MDSKCQAGQYWDNLLRECMRCHMECEREDVMPKCTAYCESTKCMTLPGHYYDGLLRKCMMCKDVCGRHPEECLQYCRTSTPALTTELIPDVTTSAALNSRVAIGLEDTGLLIYSLLAISLVLLVLSLSLALVVFLMTSRTQASNSRSKAAARNEECAVKLCQEATQPDFSVVSCHPASYDLSDDSSPTETCVCVQCFPDLRALGQGQDRSSRVPFCPSSCPTLHKVLNGGPLQTEVAIPASEGDAQQESAVGC